MTLAIYAAHTGSLDHLDSRFRGWFVLARRKDRARHRRVVTTGPQDGPHGERSRAAPFPPSERQDKARRHDAAGEEADRCPQHAPAPTMFAKPLEQPTARADGRVHEVDDGRCLAKAVRAPRDGGGGCRHVTRREGQTGTAETEVPPVEQSASNESGQFDVAPVNQRRGPDNPTLDLPARDRHGDELFGAALAPGVGTESF